MSPVSQPDAPLISEPVDLRAWQDWPTLLAGPIIRKVTRTQAWIFIATKEPFRAKVLVQHGAAVPSEIPSDTSDPGVDLRAIGLRLYVGLLKVDLPNPGPGHLYSYDIQLTHPPEPGTNTPPPLRLNDLGLLGIPSLSSQENDLQLHVPLGYGPGMLPNFLTPPDNLADLRIAQASCRKPHGNADGPYEPDALPILDEIIARSEYFRTDQPADATHVWLDAVGNPATAPEYPPFDLQDRPHQLVMTGDQIYADDVSPALLDALSDAAKKLMGWTEFPPGIVGNLNEFLIEPGWRKRYLAMAGVKEALEPGGDDYDQSHLLRFGEWCAMYLMAWSPALWPRTSDGTKVRLREAPARVPVGAIIGLLDLYQNLPTTKAREQTTKPITFLFDKAKAKVVDSITAADDAEKERAAFWTKHRDPAMQYGSTVPYVRRVMANTPTYLMFDDHEITDDWYITRDVADRLLGLDPPQSSFWGKHVGPRILRNGLSAYAIFQHWGNVPEDFAGWDGTLGTSSVGVQLLENWDPFHAESGPPRPILAGPDTDASIPAVLVGGVIWWQFVEDATAQSLPPEITEHWMQLGWEPHDDTRLVDDLLRINTYPTNDDGTFPGTGDPANREAFGRFRWDYAIEFDSHHLMAIDTRTWRRFPTGVDEPPPGGGPSPTDVFLARDATALILDTYAEAWAGSTDQASILLGGLLNSIAGLLRENDLTLFAGKLGALGTALQAYLNLVLAGTDALPLATTAIDEMQSELAGTAPFSTRLFLETPESYWARAAAILDEVNIPQEFSYVTVINWTASATLPPLARYMEAVVLGSVRGAMVALRTAVGKLEDAIPLDSTILTPSGSDRALIAAAGLIATGTLTTELAALTLHERSSFFFRDGAGYLAPELISAPAMEWMVTAPIAGMMSGKETVILSPAPLFADDAVDVVQRSLMSKATSDGLAGSEEWEFESWSANPVGFDNFVVAAKALDHVTVLSGDVHYAYSSVNHVTLEIDEVDTIYIQLTASAAKNSDGTTKKIGTYGYLAWNQESTFNVHQFSPVKLFQNGWDYFQAGDIPNDEADPYFKAERFIGWLGESLEGTLRTSIQAYHLDDVHLMLKEYWAADTVAKKLAWHTKWFFNPALRVVGDVTNHPDRYAEAAWDYISTAPLNSFFGWIDESLFLMMSTYRDYKELLEDPTKKIFGHRLYSRDVFIKQITDIYKALGVDPAYGYKIKKTSLADVQGAARLMSYGARNRFDGVKDPKTMMYGSSHHSHIVGDANVGLVRFIERDGRPGVRHDILFHPAPTHPGIIPGPPGPPLSHPPDPDVGEVLGFLHSRDDWMSTRHEGFFMPQTLMPQTTPADDGDDPT